MVKKEQLSNIVLREDKVNWDLAIEHTNRRLVIGVIVRDHLGHVIASKSQTTCIVSEPLIVKVIAALHVVEFSRDLGLQSIIILEGDPL
jgi:hypothetical protein